MADEQQGRLLKELEFDLASPDVGTRRHALITLGTQGKCLAAFEVMKRLMSGDENPELRYLARKFFNDWRPSFEERPPEPAPQVFAEGQFDERRARDSFVAKDQRLKIDVAQQIVEQRDKRALPLVLEALKSEKDPFVISSLVKAVGAAGDASQIPVLQAFLRHEDSRVRANTVEGLEMIGDDVIFPLLVPMLQDTDNRVKGNAIKALLRFDEDSARDLVRKLARSSKEARRDTACHCIKVAKRPWCEDLLVEMARAEQSEPLYLEEVALLGELGGEAAAGFLAAEVGRARESRADASRAALAALRARVPLDDAAVERLKGAALAAPASGAPAAGAPAADPAKSAPAPREKPAAKLPAVDESSRWDLQALGDLLPKLKSKLPAPVPAARPPAEPSKAAESPRLGESSRRFGARPVAAKPAAPPPAKASLNERLPYLLPAAGGAVLLGVVGLAALFSGGPGGGGAVKPPVVVTGQRTEMTCRVRFVDKRKSTVTLASGENYYLARLPAEVDLGSVKVNDTVRVVGLLTDEKHFDARILQATALTVVDPAPGGEAPKPE